MEVSAQIREELNLMSKNLDIIVVNSEKCLAEATNKIDELTKEIQSVLPEDDPKKLCQYTEKIQKISELIDKLNSYITYINELLPKLQSYAKEIEQPVITYITNKLNIISLKIKRSILYVQIKLVNTERRLLILASKGKIAPALQAIFGTIIIAIQAIFMAINIIIGLLDKILLLIPFILSLAIEGMSFFLTPKSLSATKMTIVNTNQSVERIIPTAVITTINEILDAPLYLMGENKQVAMAASASASAAAVLNKNSDVNFIVTPANISYKAREYLLNAVNLILAVLPIAEPLPKYERLPMWKNLGFFIWLLTGWCPAGKRSFGLLGMP